MIRANMRKYLKVLLWTALVLMALLNVVLIIGYRLPREHVVSRTLKSKQPPQAVWAVISDHTNEPGWRPGLKKVEHSWNADRFEVWRETYSSGDSLSFATIELEPPRRMVRVITDEGIPFGGRWEYEVKPNKDGGSQLTITEHGEVYKPLYRFVSKYVMGHTRSLDQYLRALAAKLGEPAQIS